MFDLRLVSVAIMQLRYLVRHSAYDATSGTLGAGLKI